MTWYIQLERGIADIIQMICRTSISRHLGIWLSKVGKRKKVLNPLPPIPHSFQIFPYVVKCQYQSLAKIVLNQVPDIGLRICIESIYNSLLYEVTNFYKGLKEK